MGNPFGKMNMGDMMKQAKKMMAGVQKAQEELADMRIEAASGGGMVKAVVSGTGDLLEIKIDPQVVDPDDVEMLQDLVVTAVHEALADAKEAAERLMGPLTGGMNLPGLM
jgi:nucleoid-associated protein EbfC